MFSFASFKLWNLKNKTVFPDSIGELIVHSPVPSWCKYGLKKQTSVTLKPTGEVRRVLAKQQSRWAGESAGDDGHSQGSLPDNGRRVRHNRKRGKEEHDFVPLGTQTEVQKKDRHKLVQRREL